MKPRWKKELQVMWSNVVFRSLVELLAVIAVVILFMILIQHTAIGQSAIQQTKERLGLPQ